MKILVLNWQDIKNPLGGGAEVHMHQIFSRIARRGHDVTLFCSSFNGAPGRESIDGINVIREGRRLLFSLYVPLRYFTHFRHENFDVVVDDFNKVPFFTPLFIRRPLVFIFHHLFGAKIFLEAPFPVALVFSAVEWLGVTIARNSGSAVAAVSPSTKAELTERGFTQVEIIYNCVDHELHVPDAARRSRSPLVGYFGRLKKYKSVDHLLRAFSRIRDSFPDARLVIIGEGDHRPALERLSAELHLEEAVRFTGFVDEKTKVRLLQEIWFVVNTSAKEGWGLTVVESNACGTPVVASDVPGLRDAIKDGETGLLYPYGNVTELAGRMTRLLTDRGLRERLSTAAVAWAKTFNWDDAATNALALLESQVSKSHA